MRKIADRLRGIYEFAHPPHRTTVGVTLNMQKIKALAHLVLALSALIFASSFAIQTMRSSYTIHRVGQGPLMVRLNPRTGEAHVAIARPDPTAWRLVRESAVDAVLATKEGDNNRTLSELVRIKASEDESKGSSEELSADEILKKYGLDAPENQESRSEPPDRGTESGGGDSSTR